MHLYAQIAGNLALAWAAGGLIGMERSYHGRAAGFRTHCLVAIASAAAIMVAFAPLLVPGVFPSASQPLEATRLGQGVMTGVGFLGAGVIFKEGINVQGLTTAASVWATAAIGLLFGLGAWWPAALATGAVLATLILLRWVEQWAPSNVYAWSVFSFRAEDAPTTEGLKALLQTADLSLSELSYARRQGGAVLEFSGNLRARRSTALTELAQRLRGIDGLVEFELQRISK